MNSRNWKDKLLASSLPLEYEAARILKAHKYYVRGEFRYLREDTDAEKEFSVDILAHNHNHRLKEHHQLSIDCLVECKYRNPSVNWLFTKKVAPRTAGIPTFSGRLIDQFSSYGFKRKALQDFEKSLPIASKGVELHSENGSAFDAEIRHGLAQLQNALLTLIHDHVSTATEYFPSWSPILVFPVLLTSAELFLLKDSFSTASVRQAKKIEDLGKVVPYLSIEHGVGPVFMNACRKHFASFDDKNFLKNLDKPSRHDLPGVPHFTNEPREFIQAIRSHMDWNHQHLFSKFIVCNKGHFSALLKDFSNVVDETIKSAVHIGKD